MIVFGTRPELIKVAPVIRELDTVNAGETVLVNTGQHRELLDPLLESFGIEPDVNLDVMRSGQGLSALTARLVEGIGEVVRKYRPAALVVQGDTTSAFCGSLAAFYERVPVAHVEAGLRSGVPDDPFPEELNRRLVARLARWHFAPTPRAASALRSEGIAADALEVTGNTVIDNLRWVLDRGAGRSAFPRRTDADGRRRVLVTLHRRENQGSVMQGMAEALRRIADRGDVEVLLPLHRSPAVRDVLVPALDGVPGVVLVEALDYLDFTATLAGCDLVLTDSGGIQEEAPSLGKPVLVLRRTTERPEAIEGGVARLVGTEPDAIHAAATTLLDDPAAYAAMATAVNPFGDGHAARRIVRRLNADLAAQPG